MMPAEVRVDFWNVGQGDASTITFDNDDLLVIDVGPFNSSISRWIVNARERLHIKILILTHNDADHIGGLEAIVNAPNVTIDTAYMLSDCHLHGEIRKIVKLLLKKTRDIKRLECKKDKSLKIFRYNDYLVELRYPLPIDNLLATSSNRTSGIVVLSYNGQDCVAWGGDSMLQTMRMHIKSGVEMQFGPHHGAPQDPVSQISSALQDLCPQRCFISVGTNNRHSHPKEIFLNNLRSVGCLPMCSQVTKRCPLYQMEKSIYNSCALYGLPPPQDSAISCWGHVRFYLKEGVFDLDSISQQVPNIINSLPYDTICKTLCIK